MPIYEYECEKCGRIIESWQKINDPPLTTCEHCGGRLHKLISMSTFHLKGTGWYVTDYGGRKQSQADKKDSGSEKKSCTTNSCSCSTTNTSKK